MQERLIVKNFGPIKEVDLDLSQTTVFIGEQASGKSTLAKLIAIFRDANSFLLIKGGNLVPFHNYLLIDLFTSKTEICYISNKVEIIYTNKEFNILKDEISPQLLTESYIKQLEKIQFLATKRSNENSAKKRFEIDRQIVSKLSEQEGSQPFLNDLLKYFGIDIYVPAERTLIPMIAKALFSIIDLGIALPKTITGFGNKFEQSRQNIKNYSIDFLNIQYQFHDGVDFIIDNLNEIELSSSSSGLQALIPMLLVIEGFSNDISLSHFIIEEPELNLYPTTQHNLTKFIAAKCTSNNQQLTITTHSPYLLSSMNILLFAHQAGQIDEAETSKIIPKESWINPNNFNAYFIEKGGTARPIFNKKSGMISENELDNVSLDLGDEFDKLMDIYQGVPA